MNVRLDISRLTDKIKNVDKFIPERWLNGEMEGVDPFYYIPFSAGPRNCIG